MSSNAQVVLHALDALEMRQLDELQKLYHPSITFHWPPGLPYSGNFSGAGVQRMSEMFAATWTDLQPDAACRRMDPEIIAEDGNIVVVSYTWRGIDRQGRRFETETLAKYEVVGGQLLDAQMFHFDLVGLIAFLENSRA